MLRIRNDIQRSSIACCQFPPYYNTESSLHKLFTSFLSAEELQLKWRNIYSFLSTVSTNLVMIGVCEMFSILSTGTLFQTKSLCKLRKPNEIKRIRTLSINYRQNILLGKRLNIGRTLI